jgi:cell wall-associated NlpC family hydrolase
VTAGLAVALSLAFVVPLDADASTPGNGPGPSGIAKQLRAKVLASKTLSPKRKVAVRVALEQRGDRYRYGAKGPNAFDCSGLMYYSWRHAGKAIPRTSSAQRRWARNVGWAHKLPGDLLFYRGHAAMYVGAAGGKQWMMEAPHRGKPVRLIEARMRGLLKVGAVR